MQMEDPTPEENRQRQRIPDYQPNGRRGRTTPIPANLRPYKFLGTHLQLQTPLDNIS